jgi:hypothetical protein
VYTTADTDVHVTRAAPLKEQTRRNYIVTIGYRTRIGQKRMTFLIRVVTAKVAGSILPEEIAFLSIWNGLPHVVKS